MGADMLIYALWIREDRKPDWAKAEAAVKDLRWGDDGADLPTHAEEGVAFTMLEGEHENGPAAEAALQALVTEHLTLLREGIDWYETGNDDHWCRELARLTFDGWTVYVTGGMSNGDRPTDLAETFDLLEELEITSAAGFFETGNATTIAI